MKLFVGKDLNFNLATRFSTLTVLQLTRCCQAVSGPKIDYRNWTPTLFPSFGSK